MKDISSNTNNSHNAKEDIENIIDSYLSIMKKYIQFSYEPFHVYVMERDNPYLIFAYLITSVELRIFQHVI